MLPDRFRDVDHALDWAYRVTASDIVKLSVLGKMRGAESQVEKANPFEMHGQGAQILGHVTRLPDLGQAYVHARYWPSRGEGGNMDASYREALRILVLSVLGTMGTGTHSQRAANIEVLQYFEGATSKNFQGIRWVQAELKVRKTSALEHRRGVWDRLDAIHRDSWSRLDGSLREAGLLGLPEFC